MKVTQAPPFTPVRQLIESHPLPGDSSAPGLVIGLDSVIRHDRRLQEAVFKTYGATPYLVISPDQTPSFLGEQELASLKELVKLIAKTHPKLGLVHDSVWLIWNAIELVKDRQKLAGDPIAAFFKIGGLALDVAGILDSAYPSLKMLAMPDPVAEGIEFALKTGGEIYLGTTAALERAPLAAGEQQAIASTCVKAGLAALDPHVQRIHPVLLALRDKG